MSSGSRTSSLHDTSRGEPASGVKRFKDFKSARHFAWGDLLHVECSLLILAADTCQVRSCRSVGHPGLFSRCPRSTVPQQAVYLLATGLLVPKNPDFKVRNDSPSGPLHLAHSTNKLWSFTYVTHSLLRELPASNILYRSIGPPCLPVCSHAGLQSHRWMLHPNPHSLLRPAWASWVGKTIPVLLSARN
ncbi:hypothetical protein MRX96_053565 [Rhipicephalus microplus]